MEVRDLLHVPATLNP